MEGDSGNPFPDTIIADWNFLDSSTRSQCPNCKKSRKYYCYSCCVPLPHLAASLPKVKLPVKVDIIKHPGETDGKSTAPHAAILAPEDVVIHSYPCIPDYDTEKVVLVFPGEQSITLEELASGYPEKHLKDSLQLENDNNDDTDAIISDCGSGIEDTQTNILEAGVSDGQSSASCDDNKQKLVINSAEESVKYEDEISNGVQADGCLSHKRPLGDDVIDDDSGHLAETPAKKRRLLPSPPFERVVFVDATWNQTHNIVNDERLKNLRRVELKTRNSNFWRHQEGTPTTYLSTIEAIYYFVRDLHSLFITPDYKNEYDNLLFFFCFIHNKIQASSKRCKGVKTKSR